MIHIFEAVKEEQRELISLRRHFHEYPELSKQEDQTIAYIAQKLDEYGISYRIVDKGGLCAALFKQRGEPFFEPGPARFREGSPVQKLIDERRGDTELCGGLALTELRLFKERLYRRLIGDYPAHAALPSFGRNSSRRARFGANFSRIRSTTASISFPGTNSG